MTIQMMTLGVDSFPRFAGNTLTSGGTSEYLTFNYPDGNAGDLLISYLVAQNRVVPTVPDGWTSLYSNTVTATDGPSSGRLLMYRRRGTETSATSFMTPGGGTCTCVSLRNVVGNFSTISEVGIDTSPASKNLSYNLISSQIFIAMASQDGGNGNPTISMTGTTRTSNSVPGNFQSMAIGYITSTAPATGNVVLSISSDSGYAVYFTVS